MLEDMANHIDAGRWTNLRNLGDCKIAGKPVDRLDDVFRLGAASGRKNPNS